MLKWQSVQPLRTPCPTSLLLPSENVAQKKLGKIFAPRRALSSAAPILDPQHLGGSRLAILRPRLHERAPLLQEIAAPIGALNSIGNGVSERHLDDLAGKVRGLGSPIAKSRPK